MLSQKTKRILGVALALAISASTFSACSSAATPDAAKSSTASTATSQATDAPAAAGDLAYKGTLTFYAQVYQPVEPTEAKPNPPTKLREIAAEYEKLHPDIKIDFITSVSGDDYATWLKTKLSAGMAPDITWAQWGDLNGGKYPKGAFLDMNPYFEKPNPYVSGNAKWGDMFMSSIQNQTADANGEHWNVNGDYVATAVVYNKEMFKDAGITDLPTNWTEYSAVCEKLLAKGYTPWAYSFGNDEGSLDRVTWMARLFYTNSYADEFEKMAVMGSTTNLTQAEMCIAIKNGIIDPLDPKYLAWWETMKAQTKYMPADYLSATQTPDIVMNSFINKNVAMYQDGSWARANLKNANCSFEFGFFPLPNPDKESTKFATDFASTNSIGGPSAAFQFCIASEKGNKTLNEDKLAAAVDWLMYITTPENNGAIVNEVERFVPTVVGATVAPGNEAIIEALNTQARSFDGGVGMFGAEYLDAYYRTFQLYMNNQLTLEQAAAEIKSVLDSNVDKAISKLEVDIKPFLK